MNRAKLATGLSGLAGTAFLVYGLAVTRREGLTLGAVLVLLGGLLYVSIAARNAIRGEFETWAIENDSALWVYGFAVLILAVGVALQFV
ncbi:hypothetical protein SAMN04487950_2535 [Halogranum rubrum]|uniref:Uncharacterized protein n=1 Tax=Halogranum rubrum TaxID=553466 RepID=A0A1I4F064_9EURY|nr:hypothetical protein [Halogranum rubrum]SFL11382.1 hypothetical protein SAMN04487950_2535 [Halogranum rubrum]